MSEQIVIPNYEEERENLNKPPIPEGDFLAVVTAASTHMSKATPGNQSIKWSLIINLNPDWVDDGWDSEYRSLPLFPDYYTPLGRITEDADGNKSLTLSRGYGITDRMARAVKAISDEGVIDLSDVKGRLVVVTIKHVADDRQTSEDIATEGIRWSAKVNRVSPYRDANDEVAPKLEGLAEDNDGIEVSGDVEF